jgi:nucleoside-diphosphate-sugar epimerase
MIRRQIFEQPSFVPVFEDYNVFTGKHVGITGREGVLGLIISRRFEEQNIRVTSYPGDITDTASLHTWFAMHSFDYFFHFAAIVPVTDVENDPLRAYEVNAIGTYYICKELIKTQSSCWVFIASTSHVYKKRPAGGAEQLKEVSQKNPETIYGMTKLLSEQISIPILGQYKVSYCIGRIFSFTSALQKEPYLVPALRRKIEATPENGTLDIVNPDCVRDIVDAETVIDCILHLARSHFKGIVNIGSGEEKRIIDIARHIMKLAGKNIQIKGVNKTAPDSLVADVTLLRKALLE